MGDNEVSQKCTGNTNAVHTQLYESEKDNAKHARGKLGNGIKSRGWCLTDYKPRSKDPEYTGKEMVDFWKETCEQIHTEGGAPFAIFQLERCPTTDKLHIQAYVYFKNPTTRLNVQKTFNNYCMRCTVAKGDDFQNDAYCGKSETRVEGPFKWGKPCKQGERSDLKELVEFVKLNGVYAACESDIFRDNAIKYRRSLENHYKEYLATMKRSKDPELYVITGPTRSGKSTHVKEKWPEAYYVSLEKWFDGYNPIKHKTVVFDDCDMNVILPPKKLLQIVNHTDYQVEVKGGSLPFLAERVVIVNNDPPEKWWTYVSEETKLAVYARITEHLEFKFPADIMEAMKNADKLIKKTEVMASDLLIDKMREKLKNEIDPLDTQIKGIQGEIDELRNKIKKLFDDIQNDIVIQDQIAKQYQECKPGHTKESLRDKLFNRTELISKKQREFNIIESHYKKLCLKLEQLKESKARCSST